MIDIEITESKIDELIFSSKVVSGKINTNFFVDIEMQTGFKFHVESNAGHLQCMNIAREKIKELELYRQSWEIYLSRKMTV